MGKIGDIVTTPGPLNGELSFEWNINDFFSLGDRIDWRGRSPVFGFSDMCLYWILYPNGTTRDSSSGWLDLYLSRRDSGPAKTFQCTVGIKSSDGPAGEIVKTETAEIKLETIDHEEGWIKICSRKRLREQWLTMMPKNVLTIKGVLKSIPIFTKGVDELLSSMQSLVKSGKGSDVVIKVQDKEYPAHRAILGARSPVFESMLTLDMLEKNSGEVTIGDCDPEVFRHFLEYIYTGSTPVSEKNVFDLYAVSDKYDVGSLKEECAEYMGKSLTVASFCDVITLALKYDEKELADCATKFFCENSLDIVMTKDWEIFLNENTSVGNKLIIETLSK